MFLITRYDISGISGDGELRLRRLRFFEAERISL